METENRNIPSDFENYDGPVNKYKFHIGDKVQVLTGKHAGTNGIIQNLSSHPYVWLDDYSIIDKFVYFEDELKMIKSNAQVQAELTALENGIDPYI